MAVLLERGAGVDLSLNARAPLADWALPLQARGRFEDRGRGPDAFDCMGVVEFVQGLIGRAVMDYRALYRALDIRACGDVAALIEAEVAAWRPAAGGVGDVLILGHGKRPHHVAVLCGAGRMLHAQDGIGLRIDEIEGRARVTRAAGMSVFGCVAPG